MSDVGASTQARRSDSTEPRALILADSSTAMGQGHLMRCQTLTLALVRQGWKVTLCGQALTGHGLGRAVEFFQGEGIEVEFFNEHHLDNVSITTTKIRVQLLAPVMPFNLEQRAEAEHQRLLSSQVQRLLQCNEQKLTEIDEHASRLFIMPTTLVLVDHYSIDEPFYQSLRLIKMRLMLAAIDDLANRRLPVDLLLDQNFQAPDPRLFVNKQLPTASNYLEPIQPELRLYQQTPWRYEGLLPESCITLIGPQYALIRDEFVNQRSDPTKLIANSIIRRILISFGGSDPSRFTEQVLGAIHTIRQQRSELEWLGKCAIDVVVGTAYPNLQALQALTSRMEHVTLHIQTQQMALLIACADLCIGATGGSTWERALLGCPTIAFWIAPNQKHALAALERIGAIINAGSITNFTREHFSKLLASLNQDKRKELSQISRLLMGCGTGAEDVAQILKISLININNADNYNI